MPSTGKQLWLVTNLSRGWRCGGPRFDQSRIRPNLGPRR